MLNLWFLRVVKCNMIRTNDILGSYFTEFLMVVKCSMIRTFIRQINFTGGS